MRRSSVWIVILLVLTLSASASIAASSKSSIEVANRALDGRRAVVALESGEVFRGVTGVVIGPVSTQWELAGERRQVATADIDQVAIAKSSRVKRWARRGLVAGAVLGAIGIGHSETDGVFVETGGVEDVAVGAIAGAAVGAGAAALAGHRVVYRSSDPTD